MSDKDTIIKEANELLEDAQKEVLKALNGETSFLTRLFSGNKKDRLKVAQSSISRAINQMNNLKSNDQSAVGKLQKHISERDQKIKELEKNFEASQQESSTLKDQLRQYKAKIDNLEAQTKQETEAVEQTPVVDPHQHKIEEDLKNKLKSIEEKNLFLSQKIEQSQKELNDSNDLVLEFSSRMKRMKSEITSK